MKALIVEDEAVARNILERAVAKYGYEVTACDNAESGWKLYRKEQPRLVLLDWMLPGMDGVELCKNIRQEAKGKYATILMVTAKEDPEEMKMAINSGVNYYMIKPIHVRTLDALMSVADKRVHDHLEQERSDAQIAQYRKELEETNTQLEEAISRANQLAMEAEQAYIELKQIFKTVAGGILVVDKEYNILRYNESFLKLANCGPDKSPITKCYETFRSDLCGRPECPLELVKQGQNYVESDIKKSSPDGSVVYFNIISTPFKGPGGDLIGIVEHITDITARVKAELALKESEQRYKELSLVDELTGLFNKRYFNQALQLEVERARRYNHPLSLLMLDIDNFKHHNDTYGHAEGDKVLAQLGRLIAANIRTNDLGCRYGGEEFALILPVTEGKSATVVAERIRKAFALEDFYPRPEEKVNKSVSIGVAEYASAESMESLIKRADENLYRAKQRGKDRFVFE